MAFGKCVSKAKETFYFKEEKKTEVVTERAHFMRQMEPIKLNYCTHSIQFDSYFIAFSFGLFQSVSLIAIFMAN